MVLCVRQHHVKKVTEEALGAGKPFLHVGACMLCMSGSSSRWQWDVCLGLARTLHIRCMYGIFGREMTKFTVIYGVCIWFRPTLRVLLLFAIQWNSCLRHTLTSHKRLCVGFATINHKWCAYDTLSGEIIKYTVIYIYGVYIQFWPTLSMCFAWGGCRWFLRNC